MFSKFFPITIMARRERCLALAAAFALLNHPAAMAAPAPSNPVPSSGATPVNCALDGSDCAGGAYARPAADARGEATDGPDAPGCRGVCNPFGQIPEFVAAAGMPPGAMKPPAARAPSPSLMLPPPAFLP